MKPTSTERVHPLLQACRCRVSKPCLVCMRWLKHRNTRLQRRQAWRAHQ